MLNFQEKIPILKEFEWLEWFEWFGPSPIEPFNSGTNSADDDARRHKNLRLGAVLVAPLYPSGGSILRTPVNNFE